MDYNHAFSQLPAVRHFLTNVCGYDDVWALRLVCDETGETIISCYADDNFQQKLPSEHRFKDGHKSITFSSVEELWQRLRETPSRAERELHVMLRQTASSIEHRAELRSEAARAFAERLNEQHKEHQHLLTDLTGRSPIERSTNDEIPF